MIIRMGLAPRRSGLAIEAFQAHWAGAHAQLVVRVKGLRRYWQNHALLRNGEPLLPWAGFDTCTEMEFDDVAAMDAAFSDDQYPRGLKEDTDYLIDRHRMGLMLAERLHLAGDIDLRDVRLLTFMRRAPGRAPGELRSALRELPKARDARGRQLLLALESVPSSQLVSSFDAVDVQWFSSPEQAERYVVSAEAREHRHVVSHLVRGVERVIARVRVIL